jgi:hypothetical protein
MRHVDRPPVNIYPPYSVLRFRKTDRLELLWYESPFVVCMAWAFPDTFFIRACNLHSAPARAAFHHPLTVPIWTDA